MGFFTYFTSIASDIENVVSSVVSQIENAIANVKITLEGLPHVLSVQAKSVFNKLKQVISNVIAYIAKFLNNVKITFEGLGRTLTLNASNLISVITSRMQGILNAFSSALRTTFDIIRDKISSTMHSLQKSIETTWKTVVFSFDKLSSTVHNAIQTVISELDKMLSDFTKAIIDLTLILRKALLPTDNEVKDILVRFINIQKELAMEIMGKR